MKVERFVSEFAKYEKRKLQGAGELFGNWEVIDPAIERIDLAVTYRERGIITATEAVRMIAEVEGK